MTVRPVLRKWPAGSRRQTRTRAAGDGAANQGSLREGARELQGTGVYTVKGFLLTRQDDGSFVEGVEVRPGCAPALPDARERAIEVEPLEQRDAAGARYAESRDMHYGDRLYGARDKGQRILAAADG